MSENIYLQQKLTKFDFYKYGWGGLKCGHCNKIIPKFLTPKQMLDFAKNHQIEKHR